jgi:ATP-dependent DNA helicase RecQ
MIEAQVLTSAAGFEALIAQWQSGAIPSVAYGDPPFARLSNALSDAQASLLDRLVLLRHALRYESLRVKRTVPATLTEALDPRAEDFGLSCVSVGPGRFEVTALPWKPDWLEQGQFEVDARAMRAEQQRFGDDETGPPADPFLRECGRTSYRSESQQAAVRAAVAMPPGALLVIDLPTGEGKSTVFQVISRAGFASSAAGRKPGLVVIVVPTITLALDHERTFGGSDDRPLAYVGGREARNALIREAVRSRTQPILFAAPEAIVRSLRMPLGELARDGALAAVILDEAHLVDGWGTGFRTEFQTLAGVLNHWRTQAAAPECFRTVFLSATLTKASLQTLEDLFSPSAHLPVVSGARVRPEPEYWVAAAVDETVRERRVLEALNHLPRPAILYVTEVAEAAAWSEKLQLSGFSRLALVHGGTTADEREAILANWSAGQLDLVVATSAFGLGIDYPHVRTVIHACLPETFDRFYQEVGRGGRDGCSSISLLLPAFGDRQVARSLAAKKVITVERGMTRWRAMFEHPATRLDEYPRIVVPVDVPPGYDRDEIDLLGERSTDWNLRVLALMARSGMIRLLGSLFEQSDSESAPRQFERVEIVDEHHLDRVRWTLNVESTRQRIMDQGEDAFRLLERFTRGTECPARLIGELYGAEGRRVALVCSSCRLCRGDPMLKLHESTVVRRRLPWPVEAPLAPVLARVWGAQRYALVSYPLTTPNSRQLRDLADGLRRLDLYGVRLWIEVGTVPDWLHNITSRALEGRPWMTLVNETWDSFLWPVGARIIACGSGAAPGVDLLTVASQTSPAVVLVPEGAPDPRQRSRELVSITSGPVYTLQTFVSLVLQ